MAAALVVVILDKVGVETTLYLICPHVQRRCLKDMIRWGDHFYLPVPTVDPF
jgi:hypothetical protein